MIVPTMQVEIDLFSGRPNPTWELTAAEVSELKARLATLPTGSPVAMPEVLGYRGLHIAPLPGRQGINEPSSANTIIDVQVGGGEAQELLSSRASAFCDSLECVALRLTTYQWPSEYEMCSQSRGLSHWAQLCERRDVQELVLLSRTRPQHNQATSGHQCRQLPASRNMGAPW